MNFVKTLFIIFSLSSTVFAAPGEKVSENVQKQLFVALSSSPAVRGALAEAKRWAGATKCDSFHIESITATSFKAYATCTKLGDPKEEEKAGVSLGASAQIHVSGTIYSGNNKNSPIGVQIENIEFAYAG